WMIRPTLINEAKASASWNSQRVPPVGDAWKRDTYGFTFQQLFLNGGPFENGIPDVSINGFAGWNGPAQSLISPTTDIALSDNLSWIHGPHTLKTGLLLIRNRKDQNGRSPYTGSVSFNTGSNTNTTNNAFADALLGNFRTYSEAAIDPMGFFRFSQIESFVSDSWKVSRRLSLEMGVRYQYGWPTFTQANNIANFDPAFYDAAKAVTVKNDGTIDTTKGGNRFNGLVRAGAGVPPDELARVPNGDSQAVLSVPTGALRGLYQPQHLFAPRFSFALSPFNDNKTAIRGGFGIFYDRPEGNLIFPMVNLPPYAGSSQFENGNLANVKGAASAPFGNIDAIDPNLVVPYQMNFSLNVQRELPWGIFGEVAYIGNLGRHLIRQPDINAPTFEALQAAAKTPSAQRPSTNALRPYKGFSTIRMRLSDSNSNYNALQLYATKRKGSLTMTVSYTWSKVLTDSSGNTDNLEDPFNRGFNYGPASFDRRHIFVTTYTYRLPFFSKASGLVYNALGGWEVSGITRWQTGQYLTPVATGNSVLGNRRADYLGGAISQPGSDPLVEWFNKAAFGSAPDERRGTAGVGVIEGPGRYLWDLSLRKKFSIHENYKLQFQADFFNAFNKLNLNNPNVNFSNSGYDTITGAAPGRNVQLGLKLTF
ncbi:MAG TPA: carboxypeptidase regulatory-like domain-containing protein, partial [Blastocatellia bacterium]|nr:carboxypeptidase regulatory-like domain-containing protein [Blastocatellia bacterium]